MLRAIDALVDWFPSLVWAGLVLYFLGRIALALYGEGGA